MFTTKMISDKVISILEYEKILKHISNNAFTELGKLKIIQHKPFEDIKDAVESGLFVSEAKEALIQNDTPPFENLPNIQKALASSRVGGSVLTIRLILEIKNLAVLYRKIKNYLLNSCQEMKIHAQFSDNFFSDTSFENKIERIFTPSGDIKDDASPQLKKIRLKINEKNEVLRKTVNRVLKQLSKSLLVQEDYITQRDGRIVLPIKAEHKRHVKGFIHSESATGQTIYIEPEESLELNNEILSLNFAERREIERILKELTALIGERSFELEISHNTLARIDSYFAYAKYSIEIMGAFPTIDNNKPLKIIDARHPLLLIRLGRNSTVPISLEVTKDKVIVITGPNAGGKTVVLKTIGLLSLLVMSGIHIPIHIDSNLWFFEKILVDIGDLQSIEDDLSTFSSHLSNINEILNLSNKHTLVLLDELGTGTDPTEGSALAAAFLFELRGIGATVFATTHHGSLKLLANEQLGFQNASMIFDLEKLEPTYKFRIGVPGSSYAFEVAKRIGIKEKVIGVAKENIEEDKNRIEEFLVELEVKSNKMKEKLDTFERENTRLIGLTNLYQSKVKKLEEEKKNIIKDAKIKAEDYLKNVNREVENTIKRIKESNAEKSVIVEEKRKIFELKKQNELTSEVTEEFATDEKILVGDYVQIKDTNTRGQIENITGDIAHIISNKIKLKAKVNKLFKVKREKENTISQYQYYSSGSPEIKIDIRGKKPEEVEFELLKFIDNAYSNNLTQIEIIHGKGNGVLKETVNHLLKKHQGVKYHEFAKVEVGGDGVTLAYLK